MKEHSLFLKAGFTPGNAELSNKAEWFKVQFEKLLANAVSLSNGTVSQSVLDSEEIVTQFTLNAEKQTSRFTGILINTEITNMELKLSGNGGTPLPTGRV